MARRSNSDRLAQRDAYRVMTPFMFWVLAFCSFRMMKGFFGIAPWTHFVAWGFVLVLTIAGLCYVPRSIRTIREL
jgi:hypothetical protein